MIKAKKSKEQKPTLQHPPRLEFEVWRSEFEKRTRRGTSASKMLKKYKEYFNRESSGAPYASDTILHEEVLRNIYAETGFRGLDVNKERTNGREDVKRMRKKLDNIVKELDCFTAGMRRKRSPFMVMMGDGTELVGPGKVLVEAFENGSALAHDLIASFEPLAPLRQLDSLDACRVLLLDIVKFASKPIMSENEACLLAKVALQAHGYNEAALMILDDRGEGNRRKGTIRARLDMAVIDLFPKPSRLRKSTHRKR